MSRGLFAHRSKISVGGGVPLVASSDYGDLHVPMKTILLMASINRWPDHGVVGWGCKGHSTSISLGFRKVSGAGCCGKIQGWLDQEHMGTADKSGL
jgi:hypothetical protein